MHQGPGRLLSSLSAFVAKASFIRTILMCATAAVVAHWVAPSSAWAGKKRYSCKIIIDYALEKTGPRKTFYTNEVNESACKDSAMLHRTPTPPGKPSPKRIRYQWGNFEDPYEKR